jgi:hypothetical protein
MIKSLLASVTSCLPSRSRPPSEKGSPPPEMEEKRRDGFDEKRGYTSAPQMVVPGRSSAPNPGLLALSRCLEAVAADRPGRFTPAQISEKARAFLIDSGLEPKIGELPEGTPLGKHLVIRWACARTASLGGEWDVALMNRQFQKVEGGAASERPLDSYAVLAVKPGPGGAPVFTSFEEAFLEQFQGLTELRLSMGYQPPRVDDELTDHRYYVALKDPEAVVGALKSILAGQPVPGFAGQVESTPGRAAFDPTAGRKWQITEPSWSLNRGALSRVDVDIPAGEIDLEQKGAKGPFSLWVSPSNCSTIREVELSPGKWTPVLPPELAKQRYTNSVQ